MLYLKNSYNYFFKFLYSNGYFEINTLLITFIFTWIFEWFYILNNIFLLNSYVFFFFPYRIPVLLLLIFLFFIYIWSISVWRRTQYGKFTRGDRELWVKGYASFWVLEISTLAGIIIAAAWMNWGPIPLFPRNFNISKKSFLIELTLFTYIIWILYLSRFLIKWNKWNTQIYLTLFILIFINYLIWRDLLIIFGRDSLTINNGVRWRFIESNTTLYSLFPHWWMKIYINKNITKYTFNNSPFLYTLVDFLNSLEKNPNESIINFNKNFITFEKYNYINILETNLVLNKKNINDTNFILNNFNENNFYYHRRVGFGTKRISMWTFLFFLKIWHHLMLYIWWFIYLIRLFSRKKNSYQLTSICLFNVYCCFLIIFFIYIYCLFPKLIIFFRFFKDKPKMISFDRIYGWKFLIVDYFISLLNFFTFSNNKSLYYINFPKNYMLRLYPKFVKLDDIYDYDFLTIDRTPIYTSINNFYLDIVQYYIQKKIN